jgi:alkylation response protein AidB-like acyl-CoA dehydrogenase
MDFGFSAEEEALRREIAEFAAREMPSDWTAGFEYEEYCDPYWPFTRQMAKKLGATGWLGMSLPKEYGGLARSLVDLFIYIEEASYYRIPAFDMGIGGVENVGPLIASCGTEEQKQEHLPRLVSGECFWCVGYSEPNSGSDLVAAQCRAKLENGKFVIDGQKVWTSAAQIADWCWLLVRTGEGGAGRESHSLILVDMRSEGIDVRPIENMEGFASFNEVFFSAVVVPEGNLLGGVINQAWQSMSLLLCLERISQAARAIAISRRMLDEVIGCCQNNSSLLGRKDYPPVRHRLAEIAIDAEIGRLLSHRAARLLDEGEAPEAEASMARVFGAELKQRIANVGMQTLGLLGLLRQGSKGAVLMGQIERFYLSSVAETILGGTSEIQRNTIARRGMGLPRS